MNNADLIGSVAATLMTTAFIPQAWHVWHTRHTADISLGMYAMFSAGVAYGWLMAGLWHPLIVMAHHRQRHYTAAGRHCISDETEVRMSFFLRYTPIL